MNTVGKEKTGKSTDIVKQNLIIPSTVEIISKYYKNIYKQISFLDFGCGDFTTTKEIINRSEELNTDLFFKEIYLLDIDSQALVESEVNARNWSEDRELVYINNDYQLNKLNEITDNTIDLIHTSNVIHQIEDDEEVRNIFKRLKIKSQTEGILVITDLHPKYINWLNFVYPEKLANVQLDNNGNVTYADYLFDNTKGRGVVYTRSISRIKNILSDCNWKIIESRDIFINSFLKNLHIRHERCFIDEIPMFYTLVLKNKSN